MWITDITEHPTEEGKVYCAAVMDAYSRLVIGWSIAEHMRTELQSNIYTNLWFLPIKSQWKSARAIPLTARRTRLRHR